jgi:type II secretory pathway pseudopilin PulG
MSRSAHPIAVESGQSRGESRRRRSEAGDTLIEVLLALMVLGLASVALLIAFSTSIAASAEHRKLASYNNVLAVASQELTAAIQSQPALFQTGCPGVTGYPQYGLPGGVTLPAPYAGKYTVNYVTTNPVQYWNGTSFDTTVRCGVPQMITIQLAGTPYTNSFIVNYSVGSFASGAANSGTATKLVILNKSTVGGGYAGGPFTTQPIVAVESCDAFGLNCFVVTTDLSPVMFTLTSGSGTMSGCIGNEILGVVTFSGCSIGTGGTFTITATDGPSITTDSATVNIANSSFHLVFHVPPLGGQSGHIFSQSPVIWVEDSSGNQATWQGTITLTVSGGFLNPPTSGCSMVGGVSSITLTVVSGQVTLPSTTTFAGGFYYNASSSPPTTATQYTMTAVANPQYASNAAVPAQSSAFSVTAPDSACQLTFSTQPTGAVGATNATFAVNPVVTAEDAFGNVATSYSSSMSLTMYQGSSTKTLNCNSPTNANGDYTFSGCAGTAYNSNLYLIATSGSLVSPHSGLFDITNVATNLNWVTSPIAALSGAAFNVQPVLDVTDTGGRVVTAISTAINLPSGLVIAPNDGAGVITNCTNLAPTLGYYYLSNCSFAGKITTPYTLSVSVGALTSPPSASFTPTGPGTPTQLVFTTPPASTVSGAPLTTQPVVSVEDSAGNVVTSSTLTINLSNSGGTLNSCTGLTANAGVVNVSNCTFAGVVGTTYYLSATSGSLSSIATPITPTLPGAPFQVELTGCSTDIMSGKTCTVSATIVDSYGNIETPDNTSVVGFSQSGGGGTLSGLGPVTVSGGIASSTVTAANIGPVTISATGDSITSNPVSFNVLPIPQTITWTAPTTETWVAGGAGTFSLGTASDTSGSPVTFASSTTSVCTVSGSNATMITAGTCTITPTATAQGNYALTPGSPSNITINRIPQTVAFYTDASHGTLTTGATVTYAPSFTYPTYALGSGGGTLTFASSTTTVCTVNSSGLITIKSAGTCSVTADAAANTNYLDSGTTIFTLSITQASQTIITPTNPTGPWSGTLSVATTATSGLTVTYTVKSGGTATGCSVSGSGAVSATSVGTCLIYLDQIGNINYTAAPELTATATFTMASQTITSPTNPTGPWSSTLSVATTATSGLTVTYTVKSGGTATGCSVSGSGAVSATSIGTCLIYLDQAGNANYSPAPELTATATFTKAIQTITAPTNPSGPWSSTLSVATTSSSGLTVTYTYYATGSTATGCAVTASGVVSASGGGTCLIHLNQAGNSSYAAASQLTATATFTAIGQTITAPTNPTAPWNTGTPSVATTSTSGLTVTYSVASGGTATGCSVNGSGIVGSTGVGTCLIYLDQAGNASYSAAPELTATVTFTIASQTILTPPSPSGPYSGTLSVASTATSGLPVTYTVKSGGTATGCSVSGSGAVSATSIGTCLIYLDQAGNSNYSPAPELTATATFVASSASNLGSGSENSNAASVATTNPVSVTSGTKVLVLVAYEDGGSQSCGTPTGPFSGTPVSLTSGTTWYPAGSGKFQYCAYSAVSNGGSATVKETFGGYTQNATIQVIGIIGDPTATFSLTTTNTNITTANSAPVFNLAGTLTTSAQEILFGDLTTAASGTQPTWSTVSPSGFTQVSAISGGSSSVAFNSAVYYGPRIASVTGSISGNALWSTISIEVIP